MLYRLCKPQRLVNRPEYSGERDKQTVEKHKWLMNSRFHVLKMFGMSDQVNHETTTKFTWIKMSIHKFEVS